MKIIYIATVAFLLAVAFLVSIGGKRPSIEIFQPTAERFCGDAEAYNSCK